MNCTIFRQINGDIKVYEDLEILQSITPDEIVWIDIESSEQTEFSAIANKYNLHELTLEDSYSSGHSPKIDQYNNYYYLILRSLKPNYELNQIFESDAWNDVEEEKYSIAVNTYLSSNFIITHRQKELPWLDAAIRQTKLHPDSLLKLGVDGIVYRVFDILTDRFLRDLIFFDKIIDRSEDTALEDSDSFDLANLMNLRRDLNTLRQISREQRVIISRLASDPDLIRDRARRRYFKDIDDHQLAILKMLDKQIESISSVRDVYFAMNNVRLNEIMRILAVITTIAVPLNVIVGIYGMNFDSMPLEHNQYGFWFVSIFLIAIVFVMLLYFKKNKWI